MLVGVRTIGAERSRGSEVIDEDWEETGALHRSPERRRRARRKRVIETRKRGLSGRRRSEKESEIDCVHLLEGGE